MPSRPPSERRAATRSRAPSRPRSSRLELDLRSLAAFRVALGLLVGIDLLERGRWLSALYSPTGALPRALSATPFPSPLTWWSGDAPVLALLALGLVAALGFTVGLRTRLSAFVAWYCVVCLDERNPFALYGAHDVLRIFLFWSMLMPCGARAAVDPPADLGPVTGLTAFAVQAQLASIYVFSAIHKLRSAPWREGRATLEIVLTEQNASFVTRLLGSSPGLCTVLDRATIAFELIGPLLLFSRRLRPYVVASFLLFHAALGATLTLGLFPWACCAAWLLVIPTETWEHPRVKLLLARARTSRLTSRALLSRLRARGAAAEGPSRAVTVVAGVALAAVLAANVGRLVTAKPGPWVRAARTAGLDQRWAMYTSDLERRSTWFVVAARTGGGELTDAVSHAPLEEQPPRHVTSMLTFLESVGDPRGGALRATFARWACGRDGTDSVELLRMTRRVGASTTERDSLDTWQCTGRPPSTP